MNVRPYIEYPRAPCPGCQRVVSTQRPTCGRRECERKRRSAQLLAAKEHRRTHPLCSRCCLRRAWTTRFCRQCITEINVKCALTRNATRARRAQALALSAKQTPPPPKPRPAPVQKVTGFEAANLE